MDVVGEPSDADHHGSNSQYAHEVFLVKSPRKKIRHGMNDDENHSLPITTSAPDHAWLEAFLSFAADIEGKDYESVAPLISWLLGAGLLDQKSDLEGLYKAVMKLVSSINHI